MADKKISALTAASTPLAGTEVLPIVQSGATVKVAVSDLTAGRAMAASSLTTATVQASNSGGLALKNSGGTTQMLLGGGGGDNITLSVATNITPANAAVAISPTGTGTVAISPAGALTVNPTTASTINNTSIGATTALTGRFTNVTATTGSFIVGTSGQGVDFSVTSSGSGTMTSELLADYEEGTFTPTLTFGGASTGITYDADTNGIYTKIGNVVSFSLRVGLTSKGSASGAAVINGLPFTAAASPASANVPSTFVNIGITFTGTIQLYVSAGFSNAAITEATAIGGFAAITDTNFSNSSTFLVAGTYRTA
jgi:hypothetical protein